MIRKLMASSAVLALMTAGAFSVAQAQTEPTDAQQPAAIEENAAGTTTQDPAAAEPAATTDQGAAPAAGQDAAATAGGNAASKTDMAAGSADATLTPDQPTIASAFMGRTVYSSQDPESDNIGEVNDLIIGSDGMITHAVVGVGGFLGIGEKDVAVPFDELEVVEDEGGEIRLIYAATKEQLEAAEGFDRTAFDPEARAAEEQQQQAAADPNAGMTAPAGGLAPAPAGDMTAAPAVTTAPATDQQMAAGADPTANTTEQQMAAGNASPQSGAAGFVSFSADQVRASDIIGQELYGADNESIGEVSDLVLQPGGETRVAIIDVGGFLGIGEKQVAIPFDQIQLMQDAPVDQQAAAQDPAAQPAVGTDPAAQPAVGTDPAAQPAVGTDPAAQPAAGAIDPAAQPDMAARNPEPRLVVAMTREQLEQAPEWQDPAEQAAAATDTTADPNATADATQQPAAGADPNATADANQQQMAAGDPNTAAGNQYQQVTQDISAEELLGSAVYSPNDENLGEVDDVLFDTSGAIQAVVVDVGGFLGVGEKAVALQFDELNVQKNTNGDVRLMVNATQEQLENAPAYDENAAVQGQTVQ